MLPFTEDTAISQWDADFNYHLAANTRQQSLVNERAGYLTYVSVKLRARGISYCSRPTVFLVIQNLNLPFITSS